MNWPTCDRGISAGTRPCRWCRRCSGSIRWRGGSAPRTGPRAMRSVTPFRHPIWAMCRPIAGRWRKSPWKERPRFRRQGWRWQEMRRPPSDCVLQRRVFAAAPGARGCRRGAGRRGFVRVTGGSAVCAGRTARGSAIAPATPAAASAGVNLYGDPLPAGAIARLGTVRYRPNFNEFQRQIAFAADNKTLISQTWNTSDGGSFLWWDATNGKLLRTVGAEKRYRLSGMCHDA